MTATTCCAMLFYPALFPSILRFQSKEHVMTLTLCEATMNEQREIVAIIIIIMLVIQV